ncbi:HAD-IIB family hydrolase [Methylomonas methanica]|uniref:Mannosyl-3-phosphoglycerate phosphatase family n=1 Tax=Methylomonas methanica (strain DSM 25384 / MC09) TaxID=857087 RepID=F9ZZ82_METMM|nr:HAD-IIB family hydrolase [Methylomonas methanica]AEG01108.1 mannosyl-3-phosphoglycerate phosphatase family [Methylomonas methanica MC09]
MMSGLHPTRKLLISTDLDGCLLDHHDYGFAPAAALLQKLEDLGIPVIPNSSKTLAELLHFRETLNNSHPFIIENGAAVYIPTGYFADKPEDCENIGDFWIKTFSQPRRHWLKLISQSRIGKEKFQTFADAALADIVKLTGLQPDAAARASQRQYGEPVAWLGTTAEKAEFIQELRQLGAHILEGGRFLHVSGECDKGTAMKWLVAQYLQACGAPITTIAAGDSQNDIAMLESADIAVRVPSPTHALPALEKARQVYTAARQGPSGWSESISAILANLNIK